MKSVQQSADTQISSLNSLLRGELSAVETYDLALKQIGDSPSSELTENRDCHFNRTIALRKKIVQLGGKPADSSGLWGGFARTVERGAAVIGKEQIINALEEGEDRGLADYRSAREKADADTLRFIDSDLLPAQQRTHNRMSVLQKA